MKKFLPRSFHLCASLLLCALASTTASAVSTQKVLQGDNVIWGFDFIDENKIIFSERSGGLFLFDRSSQKKTKLPAPVVWARGQGGLLDVYVLKKDPKTWVYLSYSEESKEGATTALARAEWKDNTLSELKTIFRAKTHSDSTRHFGSRMVAKGEHLFMTIGDRGKRDQAQVLGLHTGKILRLTLDGKAAKGNPFAQQKDALPEIWSYGHRNPQGIDIDPKTGEIYSCEFGPRGGDELNWIRPGINFGWPVITYGSEYWGPKIGDTKKAGMEQPLKHWTPSISPSGMAIYRGSVYPNWDGNIFLANLRTRHVRRLEMKNRQVVSEESLFEDLNERIRQIKVGPDEHLYFSTDSGQIFKILPDKKAKTS